MKADHLSPCRRRAGLSVPIALAGLLVLISSAPITSTSGSRLDAQDITPRAGSAAISGVVSDARTGVPLGGATVSLMFSSARVLSRRQLTDARGRFVFTDLPAASDYLVSTSRPGYLDGGFGMDSYTTRIPRPIALRDGQWFDRADVPMGMPGAIGGRVVDENLDPVPGVTVRALTLVAVSGHMRLAAGPLGITDDRGVYRIPDLGPGRYIVSVPSVQSSATRRSSDSRTRPALETPIEVVGGGQLVAGLYPPSPPPLPTGERLAYPPAFVPAAPSTDFTTAIELGPGEVKSGIDIRLEPQPAAAVSGTLDGTDDVAGLLLRLMPAGLEHLGAGSEVATTNAEAGGRFTFWNVPAGVYTLLAGRSFSELSYRVRQAGSSQLPSPVSFSGIGVGSSSMSLPSAMAMSLAASGGSSAFARAQLITSGQPIENIVVALETPRAISGRIVWEDGRPPESIALFAEPASGDAWLGMRAGERGASAGTFHIDGLRAGEYQLRILAGEEAVVQSITSHGRDMTGRPFDTAGERPHDDVVITLTRATTKLSGTVRDPSGAPAFAAVVVFPAESGGWTSLGLLPLRVATVMTGSDGRYEIARLPAGRYYAVALNPSQAYAWHEPGFLERASRVATPITLDWDRPHQQQLDVMPVR